MRRTAACAAAFAAAALSSFVATSKASLLISEMCDPHLYYTTDRFIEIYNAGDEEVDLTGWTLVAVGNYGDIFTWALTGPIQPREALVAGDATTVTAFPVDFPDEAWSSSNGLWNGKVGDGAKLLAPGGVVVDYAVVSGTHFENADFVRNYGVTEPNPTYTPSEWTATPVELATDGSPGSHATQPPVPGPDICCIETDPEFPLAGDAVSVSAEVSDTHEIVSVVLAWGTTPTVLPNEIPMSWEYGDIYVTGTPIPAQSEGITIYFQITATNDLPGTTESDLQHYALPYDVTLQEIQGQGSGSPYDGRTVVTGGVITARLDDYFVLQSGSGAWSGIWARGTVPASVGDSLRLRARVTESEGDGNEGQTLLVEPGYLLIVPGAPLPAALPIPTDDIAVEAYEGVLVSLSGAACTDPALGHGEWEVNDGSGEGRIGDLAVDFVPTLGTTYDITGPIAYSFGRFKLEPRDASDLLWARDDFPPRLVHVAVTSDSTIIVAFSEAVEEASAETPGHYTIPGLDVGAARRDAAYLECVHLTLSPLTAGNYAVTASGVEDLFGNAADGTGQDFAFTDPGPPDGYYAGLEGLTGEALQAALHEIIDGHTVWGYDYAWTAYRSTDPKPNGKVWDVYSDTPGERPPYEYTFGVDEGGIGGREGEGYTREHSWPQSWFDGGSPMNSDLFALYPCDAHVNGNRGNYPYGEVEHPEWVSLNGSLRGLCAYPGYSGMAFEPIDEYKGDLARTYFYMSTRYHGEDAGWPGSAMTDGAALRPWAAAMLLEWHAQDPVSWKEVARNSAIFALQQNRNPFIDRPELARLVFDEPSAATERGLAAGSGIRLGSPNPSAGAVTLRYDLAAPAEVHLAVYDVGGREVARLAAGPQAAGRWSIVWDLRRADGDDAGPGLYLARLRAGEAEATQRLVVLR